MNTQKHNQVKIYVYFLILSIITYIFPFQKVKISGVQIQNKKMIQGKWNKYIVYPCQHKIKYQENNNLNGSTTINW